jgi:hypothetical protein
MLGERPNAAGRGRGGLEEVDEAASVGGLGRVHGRRLKRGCAGGPHGRAVAVRAELRRGAPGGSRSVKMTD